MMEIWGMPVVESDDLPEIKEDDIVCIGLMWEFDHLRPLGWSEFLHWMNNPLPFGWSVIQIPAKGAEPSI